MGRLTDKQEIFCREYILDLNATQAAIRAGYSEKTARSQSARLLTNVNILDRITELKNERAERLEIDANDVLQEVYWIAKARATDVVNVKNGRVLIRNTEDLSDNIKAAIASIGETNSGITVKMHSKTDALEKLMRHLGLYEIDNSQTRPVNEIKVEIVKSAEPVTSEDDINEDI